MTGVDIVILCVVVISALIGVFRGFIKEIFSLASLVVAFSLTYLFRDQVGAVLPLGEDVDPKTSGFVGGTLIVIGVLVLGGLASNLLHKLVKFTGLTGTDRTLGVAFGFLRGCMIVLALSIGLPLLPLLLDQLFGLPLFGPVEDYTWWNTSKLIPVFLRFEEWALILVSDILIWANEIFG